MERTMAALFVSRPSIDIKWTWPRILLDGLGGLGEDGVESVSERKSSDNISKLCDRRPESRSLSVPVSVSGEDRAFFDPFSVLNPLSDPGPPPLCVASARMCKQVGKLCIQYKDNHYGD